MSPSTPPSFQAWAAAQSLPAAHRPLTDSVLPALLTGIARIGAALRHRHHVAPAAGSPLNAFGDTQLNVDVLAEQLLRDALSACPSVATASSEEDPIERRVHDSPPASYTIAFDPLDGSSIIGPNWTVGTIAGIWSGPSALSLDPSTHQVAAVLGVYGPRTTALVAIRLPGLDPLCVEVGLPPSPDESPILLREAVLLEPVLRNPRYFAPANLRAAAEDPRYWALVTAYVRAGYTLRYSGGLVPDVVHALVKGRGVYLSPVTARSAPKLRRLYELLPVALVVECAGGRAVDPAHGGNVLATPVRACDERGGIVCGNGPEVDFAMEELGRAE
ncbi:hypothetical protein E4U42_000098 [Claviceps africana]|uniref:Sedoheptulose-1,7-bisphosphatase n=1 Tax=Claviceps africana TaxID=83212 RepID=A0A8K0J229_9HYPO|nr:hypothetical protein E4U42_000098 [Claviceps africana]